MNLETSNYKWVKCKNCGHKLFKVFGDVNATVVENGEKYRIVFEPKIEIKCHSCKEINDVGFIK